MLRASIRLLLDIENTEPLPATYQRLFTACRAVVCEAERGQGLYESLKLSLEQGIGKIATRLVSSAQTGEQWLESFVNACEWFEKQVVRVKNSITVHHVPNSQIGYPGVCTRISRPRVYLSQKGSRDNTVCDSVLAAFSFLIDL